MKTNQLMTIAFKYGEIQIFNKTKMADLTQTFTVGNAYRIMNGEKAINFTLFMNSKATKNFINEIAMQQGINPDEVIKHNGKKGKASKTYANLHFVIYTAMQLSPKFQYEVIDIFINSRILEFRDQGGNDFKRLNKLIDTLEDRTKELKPKGNRGCYIQVSKMLREKIFTKEELESVEGNIWNSSLALKHHQELREEYETKLCSAIELGLIKTYSHLKEVIEGL